VLYEVKGGGGNEVSRTQKYRWLYKRVTGKQNHDTELANEVWACCMNKKKR